MSLGKKGSKVPKGDRISSGVLSLESFSGSDMQPIKRVLKAETFGVILLPFKSCSRVLVTFALAGPLYRVWIKADPGLH